MPDPVRVRDDITGHEYSTHAVSEDGEVYQGLTVLKDEPAVDALGNLLPPKYPEPASDAAESADVPPVAPPASGEPSTATAAKPTAKAPRPTEPTTGSKTTSEA